MQRRFREVVLLAVSLAVGACANPNRVSSSAVQTDNYTSPRMEERDDRLTVRRNPGMMQRYDLEVPIDENGQVLVDKIQFRGALPPSAQQEVIAWLMKGKFVPAIRNGVRVPGIYKLSI
jgi:hypothetical protein